MNTLQKIGTIGTLAVAFLTGCETTDEYLKEYSEKNFQENVIIKGTAGARLSAENSYDALFNLYTTKGDTFLVNRGINFNLSNNKISEKSGKELSDIINNKDTLIVFGSIYNSVVEAQYVLHKDKLIGVYR